ncbi:MAG: hypothetical protein ACLSUT_06500 [Christensenellales bacterium]|jgi:hypothetical protein
MTKKQLFQWTPAIISMALAAITAVIYTLIADEIKALTYFQVFGSALVPLVLPLFGMLTGKKLPTALGFLLAFHVFISIDLGNAMNFYDLIPCWDLILHGFFGFVGCVTAAVFLIRWNGDKMTKAGFLITAAVFTIACGGIWEIFEYCCDLIMGTDIQRVQESIALGKSPLADTIEDMAITFTGVALFYAAVFIDKLCGGKVCRIFYNQTEKVTVKNRAGADESKNQ